MGIRTSQITAILVVLIVPAVIGLFWFFKSRAENKINTEEIIRPRPPKILLGFFLGAGILFLLGGTALIIYTSIVDSENTTAGIVIAASLVVAAFSSIGFFGYAWARFTYVVADGEGIHSYKLFRKKRFYRYEEIGSFNDTTPLGAFGGLKCYDKNNKKIFTVDAMYIGISALIQRLRERGVEERGQWQLKK